MPEEILEIDEKPEEEVDPKLPPEDQEPEGEEEEGEKPAEPSEAEKVERGWRARINEATGKRRQAEEEALYWRGVAEGRVSQQQPAPTQQKPPEIGQFEKYEDFLTAMAGYEARKAASEIVRGTLAQQAARSEEQSLAEMAALRISDGTKKYPELQSEIDHAGLSHDGYAAIVNTAIETDVAADILHHLATNPAELARISRLPLMRQFVEVGKLEARFESAAAPPAKPATRRVSNAPEPPRTPIGGSQGGPVDTESMSTEEWIKHRDKQIKKLASQGLARA